jgi:hypothetical protein
VIEGIEEGTDIKIKNPVELPTALSCPTNRLYGRFAWTISIRVRMEAGFHCGLQDHLDYRLGDPIGYGRYAQVSCSPIAFRDRDSEYGWRKVRSRRHAVPDPIEIVLEILLERLNRLAVRSRSTTRSFDPQVGFPHQLLFDVKRLYRVHRLLPLLVDLRAWLDNATPSLHRLSPASPLLRAAPPLDAASVL